MVSWPSFSDCPTDQRCSRNILSVSHCNPSDPSCIGVLTTAYHTVLSAVLLSWSPKYHLTPVAFVLFVQSVLRGLPSTSASTSLSASTNVSQFGDILTDIIWSIDAELDEILADAKATLSPITDQSRENDANENDRAALVTKLTKVKQNAEVDKETLVDLVKRLLVCVVFCTLFSQLSL
jgi:THO complex subunit 2